MRSIETARYVSPVACHTAMVHTISGLVLHRLRRMSRSGDVPEEASALGARMVALVEELDPDFFRYVGREPLAEEDLLEVVAELGADAWVDLRGQVDDDELVAAYRRAWVVASASASEGWGMTLTEGAACGTPAVATRIPGHEDAVEHGVTGLLADDERQLADHLADLLADDDRRSAFGTAALARSARCDWDRTATEAFRVLASTARRGP